MTEKQQMRDHILGGASIVEACENVDLTELMKEGETELVKTVEDILVAVNKLDDILCLSEDDEEYDE